MAQDIRHAGRCMRRNPGFTAVAVFTLALGIGANTAIFSVVNAVLLRPLPYNDPGRLVELSTISYDHFEFLKRGSHSFEHMAVYYRNTGWSRVTLTGIDEPESFQAAFVSTDFFPTLGVAPAIGRVFTAAEESKRERVTVLSDALWRRRFSATQDVVGKTLEIDGANFQVIGVMPPEFQMPAREAQFWAPIGTNRYWLDRPRPDGVHSSGFYLRWNILGRLKPGVDIRSAQAEMNGFATQLERADPELNKGLALTLLPLRIELGGSTRLALLVLLGAVALVLLIACSNVANLVLARGATRGREMAIRTALGAARARLIRQLLTESLSLASIAAVAGLGIAALGVRALVAFGPPDIPRLEQTGIDGGVLAFTLGISLLAAIFFGLMPAWKISQTAAKSRARRLKPALVVFEFALSVVLLTGAGLLIRSILAIEAVDPGFTPQHILTMRVVLRPASYEPLLQRMRALPGVQSVGGTQNLFELQTQNQAGLGLRAVEGHEPEPPNRRTGVTWPTVSGDYFLAMGVRLLRGRTFSNRDGADSPLVAVIDESLARHYWPGEDPIGRRFKGQDSRGKHDDWLTVIGLVGDMRRHGLERQPSPHVFEWYKQSGGFPRDLVVRTAGDPVRLVAALRGAVRDLDRTAVISSIETMEQQLGEQIAPRRFQTWLLALFSLLALVLASIGIYALMHYSVAHRTHEIGIRMALGARMGGVLAMVMRQGLSLCLLGLAVGLAGAWWISRLFASLLYGVTPADPLTFAVVSALLIFVAALASLIPAWRASRVDPLVALRHE
jgi:predicted permease